MEFGRVSGSGGDKFAEPGFLQKLDVYSLCSRHARGSVVDEAGIPSEWTVFTEADGSAGARGWSFVMRVGFNH